MNFSRSLALIPLLSLSLFAAAPKFGFEGQLGAVVSNGDLYKMTKTSSLTGYSLGLSARIESTPDMGVRLFANLLSIRGEDGTGLEKAAPRHLNAGLDIYKETGKLTFFGGLGIMKWKQDSDTATLPKFTDLGGLNNEGKGTKLAGRVGLEYAFTPKFHGVVSFTQTEFNKVYQPSWFTVGMSYRFASF